MNQALNLVANAPGKGTNRRSENAIGMADPLTRRTILHGKISISSIHNTQELCRYAPICFTCYFHLFKYTVSIMGRFVIFMGDDHCFVQILAENERDCRRRSDMCKRLLVTRFGNWLIRLSASHVRPPILLKLSDIYILTVRGHTIGKSLQKGIIRGVTLRRCGAVHFHVHLSFIHGY